LDVGADGIVRHEFKQEKERERIMNAVIKISITLSRTYFHISHNPFC
jgi:hypothetical protein